MISILKVNIGLCLVGVIIGEFIGARQGLGYLIIYSSQVFKLDARAAGHFNPVRGGGFTVLGNQQPGEGVRTETRPVETRVQTLKSGV